ncbi:hypothetical protein [Pseudomonas fontis]|uniref:Uncharacterized protein n=1 Tax=Pseudomonas fontis TaxID=2942633 RepID=A0ABT5NXY3_9PSED|nr:hypothetical protein [Pseudomonas fontis]MDD0973843.1 hypothetical protein [Pseudomonas fontis]MDD0992977.1 hypothetical protein [Pseudomonas fontis]
MKKLVQKKDLVDYLKGLAAASMLVVSMSSPVFEIASTIKSTAELAIVVDRYGQYIGDGPYMIESKPGHEWKDAPIPDPVIAGYAIAFTISATLASTGRQIGGYQSLISGLSGYEFLSMTELTPEKMCASLLVKMPSDPSELQKLRELLAASSVMFSMDDGSGHFHEGNTMMGNGVPLS